MEDFQQQDMCKKIKTSRRKTEVTVGLKDKDGEKVGLRFGQCLR